MVVNIPQTQYEPKTLEIARELIAATREKRSLFDQMRDQMRLDDKMLDWTMANPALRYQLFSFIDCLPALKSKAEIARHFQEYMSQEDVELPDMLKKLITFADADSPAAQLAATTVEQTVKTLAYKYIAGETIPKTIKTIEKLRKEKQAFTLDLLGEAVITEIEAESYLNQYLELITELSQAAQKWPTIPQIDEADGEALPKVQVSVKLTAFYSQFDPLDPAGSREKVCDRIRTLLRKAQEVGAAIHFDMEQYRYKDMTLAILKDLLLEEEFRNRTDIGMTIQGYLRDSERDLKGLVEWAKTRGNPITIRLVKGAYWDQETIIAIQNDWPQPVYNQKAETDRNYESLMQILLENHQYLYAAIGSHNVRTQARAMAIAETLEIPRRRIELQVLYGMGDQLAKAMVKRGYRVRVYAPYGDLLPGMSYLIRRLLENTANTSFLRLNAEDYPIDDLIAPPKVEGDRPLIAKSAYPNAPNTDYANAELRTAAQSALAQVREQLGQRIQPYINGAYVQTESHLDSVNPSNPAQLVGKVGQISVKQADEAIAAAKAAFPQWRDTPPKERAAVLRKAGEIMERRRPELSAWICFEVGKILPQADAEVSEAIDFCRYYADEMERLDQGFAYDLAGETNRYHYQPRGIALVISPWNFPMAIATGMAVAALVAGNCTLLKPAAPSSVIAAKITEVLIEAGVPAGVFQYVPGPGSTVGNHMVEHPDIHLIAFTGSQEVGSHIYAEAAKLRPGQKHLKRVIAEMGGKNAIIVDESADLDQAVAGVVSSAFGYTGQKCSACSRAIVLAPVYESFLERLIEATKSLNVGPAEDPSTTVGPVVDAKAQSRILEYIETGKEGATLEFQGPKPEPGYFVPPTIFAGVSPDAVIAQEEIFGPVLAVIPVNNFAEALTVANNTNFALTGGVYSRTPSHIEAARKAFEVGNLYINRNITGAIVARQPFGGFKLSGVGSKAGGPDYLLQFLEPRVVTENIQRQGFAPIEGAE
ncbi:L-glutamate gamma-semialdehyde dehydrogenase [Spirulina sp. CCNP1310]|uniref:L-glutamate gamma-semialdehyde dehydrogenase n=1 Tax=Spirulina sp. CCNP1310 TaxID=3110249 RepID=UPI002B1F1DDD|nr:L-glutamate gamma-semialdehyde dehydrogenase [Spirulina sp. CCNP1310]MEA5418040.1 L-glutamate gamma-semialdehyde dehydrogenase [Spirulina sp. CCNP1310]